MFRPQRTTVLFAIVAEPAEKPDARLLALDFNSPPTLVSQSISLDRSDADHRAKRRFEKLQNLENGDQKIRLRTRLRRDRELRASSKERRSEDGDPRKLMVESVKLRRSHAPLRS